jgi:hypothetical protein
LGLYERDARLNFQPGLKGPFSGSALPIFELHR